MNPGVGTFHLPGLGTFGLPLTPAVKLQIIVGKPTKSGAGLEPRRRVHAARPGHARTYRRSARSTRARAEPAPTGPRHPCTTRYVHPSPTTCAGRECALAPSRDPSAYKPKCRQPFRGDERGEGELRWPMAERTRSADPQRVRTRSLTGPHTLELQGRADVASLPRCGAPGQPLTSGQPKSSLDPRFRRLPVPDSGRRHALSLVSA